MQQLQIQKKKSVPHQVDSVAKYNTGVSNTFIFWVYCLLQIFISIFLNNLIWQYKTIEIFKCTFAMWYIYSFFLTIVVSLGHSEGLTGTLFIFLSTGRLYRLKIRASTWAFGSSSVHCYNTNYNTTYCYYCYNGDHSCYYSCNSSRVCKEEK